MVDLSVDYMGLKLANPVVVASCGLTNSVESILKLQVAGAGAVVLKSLFEEQIQAEMAYTHDDMNMMGHTEGVDYLLAGYEMELGPASYLELIQNVKKAVSIPVIASLNCVSAGSWAQYARKIEAAGADALELNINFLGHNPQRSSQQIEQDYCEVVASVRKQINIPIAVKLGYQLTSPAHLGTRLCEHGVSALVLFNRFYPLDLNEDSLQLVAGKPFSDPSEHSMVLRWMALLYGKLNCDLAATTGIHDGPRLFKQLLAGATVVQIASVLYNQGPQAIQEMLNKLQALMSRHKIESVKKMRGALSQKLGDDPAAYERIQYIKALVGLQ